MMLPPCVRVGVKVTEGQVRSLTFDDLGSLFRVLHVSRVVYRADFEFSVHLNVYEVVLVLS